MVTHIKFGLLLTIIMLCNCQTKTDFSVDKYPPTVILKDELYNVTSKKEIKVLAAEVLSTDSRNVLNAQFEKFQDNLGEFYGISTKVKIGKDVISKLLVLSKANLRDQASFFIVECTMSCDPNIWCNGCTQTVTERCVSQLCDCSDGFPLGSCSSSISF